MKNQVFQNIKLINSALLFPAVKNESGAIKRTHGAYYSDGSVIEECLVIRRYGTTGKEPLKSSFVKEFDRHSFKHLPTAVYGGPLFNHYGHFLLEGLARVWALQHLTSSIPIIFHMVPGSKEMLNFHKTIFKLLSINEERLMPILTKFKVDNLLVPSAEFRIGLMSSPAYYNSVGCYVRKSEKSKGLCVWLSRSSLKQGVLINESELESKLEKNGWFIYHPEQHTVLHQLETLANASVIAGFEGSAIHTLVLLREVRARVLILIRGTKKFINENYILIARGKGFEQTVQQSAGGLQSINGNGPSENFLIKDVQATYEQILAWA